MTVTLTIHDTIAHIELARPTAMNSFNQQMANDLVAVTNQVAANPLIRAVKLSGAGPVFMAGGDLQFFYETLANMPAGVSEIIQQLNQSIVTLQRMTKPVLAVVHGAVAGAGISLMLACDLVLAASDTKFTMAYSNIATTPDGGATYFLPRLVGTKKAMELILLSDRFSALDAQQWGLINWIADPASLTDRAQELLTRLANGPTLAYGRAKQLVHESIDNDLTAQLVAERESFTASTTTADFKNGVTGFIQKQKVNFEGR